MDLNEESVEITKLALFLKVSRKDLKLPNLDNNIKCGNSIIDDPEYTNKPFVWEEEFKKVFEEGGFDIVIGNPPYVRQEKIKDIKPYLKDKYEVYTGVADLYVYFFEKGLKILKDEGMFSFICSNKFTIANYGKPLRKFILKNKFEEYIDYTGENVFEDATVDSCISIIKKGLPDPESEIFVNNEFMVPQKRFDENTWSFESPQTLNLKDKILKKGIKLREISELSIYRGILTGHNDSFIISEDIKNKLIAEDPTNLEIIKPVLRGRDVKRGEYFD